jgi:hypothetical protein
MKSLDEENEKLDRMERRFCYLIWITLALLLVSTTVCLLDDMGAVL